MWLRIGWRSSRMGCCQLHALPFSARVSVCVWPVSGVASSEAASELGLDEQTWAHGD